MGLLLLLLLLLWLLQCLWRLRKLRGLLQLCLHGGDLLHLLHLHHHGGRALHHEGHAGVGAAAHEAAPTAHRCHLHGLHLLRCSRRLHLLLLRGSSGLVLLCSGLGAKAGGRRTEAGGLGAEPSACLPSISPPAEVRTPQDRSGTCMRLVLMCMPT
jgi:hypothetical protein